MLDPAWKRDPDGLKRTFKFADWSAALAFVNTVLDPIANDLNHHPDVELGWGRVAVKLFTHDEKRVGPLDEQFAERVDRTR